MNAEQAKAVIENDPGWNAQDAIHIKLSEIEVIANYGDGVAVVSYVAEYEATWPRVVHKCERKVMCVGSDMRIRWNMTAEN